MKLITNIMLCILLISCQPKSKTKSSSLTTSESTSRIDRELKLYNVGVSLDDVFIDPNRKSFEEFGAISNTGTLLPTFEYHTVVGADVIAPVPWQVSRIELNDQGDYLVAFINPNDDSNEWYVELDHVLNVTVSVGDIVQAGQRVGNSGIWDHTQGRVELMIVNNRERKLYCPMEYLKESLRAQYETDILGLMNTVETAMSDSNIYNESAMVLPGCNQMSYNY